MTEDDRLSVVAGALGELEPDGIEWTLIVRETDTDPRAAFDRCATRLGTLAAALAMAKVTTGAVAVSAQHDKEGRATGQHEAHAALNAVAPLALGGEVAAAAMDGGADELRGPQLRFPDSAEILDALLADAVLAARRRAERMVAATGRRLGRVVSVSGHRDYEIELQSGGSSAMSRGGARPPVIPGPQRLSAEVAVVFELID